MNIEMELFSHCYLVTVSYLTKYLKLISSLGIYIMSVYVSRRYIF